MKVNLVKVGHSYNDKKTNEKKFGYNFYLVTENGNTICIKPAFDNCYSVLSYLADKVDSLNDLPF